MTPEASQRLEACLQEAAEILYRNTPAEEMTNFESLEKVVRTKMLEHVSPKIAFFCHEYFPIAHPQSFDMASAIPKASKNRETIRLLTFTNFG